MNDYYTSTGTPATGSFGASAPMRGQFALIEDGFDKLPVLSGNTGKAVIVGGSGLTVTTGTLALAGNFATTGAFSTTLIAGANLNLTLPLVDGTVATLAGDEILTNKTIVSPIVTGGTFTASTFVTPALGVIASGDLSAGTGTASGLTAGNATLAASATKLATGRTIFGSGAFDGTANITGAVGVANGGTGATTLTANNVILGNGTSAVNFVAPGTSGNVLTSNGTTWISSSATIGAVIWLATLTASSSATISDTTNITSTYDDYLIILENLIPATDAVSLGMRISLSGTFQTANYTWADTINTTTSQAQFTIASSISNTTANGGVSGHILLTRPANTSSYKRITAYVSNATSGGTYEIVTRLGQYVGATTAIDGIRFLQDTGNIASGKVHIYGLRTS